jgi:cation transport ATPase
MDRTRVWKLRNLDCAECGAKVEQAVAALPGVEKANVNSCR